MRLDQHNPSDSPAGEGPNLKLTPAQFQIRVDWHKMNTPCINGHYVYWALANGTYNNTDRVFQAHSPVPPRPGEGPLRGQVTLRNLTGGAGYKVKVVPVFPSGNSNFTQRDSAAAESTTTRARHWTANSHNSDRPIHIIHTVQFLYLPETTPRRWPQWRSTDACSTAEWSRWK